MKERLIAFTRNKANIKRANIIHWIISVLTVFMILFILKNPIIVTLCSITYIINTFAYTFIEGLSKESEDIVRNNDFKLLFLVNPDEIANIIAVMIAVILCCGIIYLNKVGVYKIVISLPQFIIGFILIIIFLISIKIVAFNISNYFREKLV